MNAEAFLNAITTRAHSLPLVILYVTEGCNMQCLMCSYRTPRPDELTLQQIESLAARLAAFGLRHIVYSGGEPLMRREFPEICQRFKRYNVKQSLLTNGLLLGKRKEELHRILSEIIISLDGPTAEVHNGIRGIDAFDRVIEGVRSAIAAGTAGEVSIRCVVQKRNFRHMGAMIELAESLGVTRISFLAADVLSGAFGRNPLDEGEKNREIILSQEEVLEFRECMGELVQTHRWAFERKFISESPQKLSHIADYYEAFHGKAAFPRNSCNAPMISTVITSTGDLQPCFFLPAFGTVHGGSIEQTLNMPSIRSTRSRVKEDSMDRCQTCVCTLKVSPFNALRDRF